MESSDYGVFRLFIGLAVISAVLSGCALTPTSEMERNRHFIPGSSSVTMLYISGSDDDKRLVSAIRTSGLSLQKIDSKELVDVRKFSKNQINLTIVTNHPASENLIETIQSDSFSRFSNNAMIVLASVVANHAAINERTVDMNALVWPAGLSLQTKLEAPLEAGKLSLLIAGSSDRELQYGGSWWSSIVALAAHELAHVNQLLLSPENHTLSVDSEAAATIVSMCARIQFFDVVGAPMIAIEFGNEEDQQAFPGIDQGLFDPALSKLDHIESAAEKGYVIGLAAVISFFPQEEVDFSNRAQLDEFYRYCEDVANRIPQLSEGEMR